MKTRDRDVDLLKEKLKINLELSNRARFHFDLPVSKDLPLRSDIFIKDGKRKILVEICHTASWDDLSHLVLLKELEGDQTEVVIAGKIIPDTIQRATRKLNIKTVHLSDGIFIHKDIQKPRGKLTSVKAWNVILNLIANSPCSIRSISNTEGISYSWTHGVIKNLISREIAERRNDLVEIVDINTLLNAVAWERPLRDLEEFEITTSFDSTYDLARTLTDWSDRRRSSIVMCTYIAATIHFGAGVRNDLVHCYVDDIPTIDTIKEEFSSKDPNGIKLKVLKPDRNVTDESVILENIKVTSRKQTVLDIAGLGYSGKDLLLEMVKSYGENSS